MTRIPFSFAWVRRCAALSLPLIRMQVGLRQILLHTLQDPSVNTNAVRVLGPHNGTYYDSVPRLYVMRSCQIRSEGQMAAWTLSQQQCAAGEIQVTIYRQTDFAAGVL